MSNVSNFHHRGFTSSEIFGPTKLKDEIRKLHQLLDGKTDEERFEIARNVLRLKNPEAMFAVIKTARITGERAGPLVPDLLELLTCELVVPFTSIRENGIGHAPIAGEAAFAIEQIGVAPDHAALRQLLIDPRRIEVPHANFNRGYIGDTLEVIVPAALAARLVPLLGDDAFDLATLIIPLLTDPEPQASLHAKIAITLLAERARDRPTNAAAPMIEALRESGLEFAGPTWVAARLVLAGDPTS